MSTKTEIQAWKTCLERAPKSDTPTPETDAVRSYL